MRRARVWARGRVRIASFVVAVALAGGCAVPGQEELQPPAAVKDAPSGSPAGTLRVGITSPGTVDPGSAHLPAGQLVASTMCDTLVETDPVTGELRPGLAQQWRVTDDGSHMTIKLRKGLKFSDGTKIDARAIVYSLSRLAKAEYASEMASLLQSVNGYPALHGEVESRSQSATERLIGVRVTDPLGVEIRLARPHAELLRALAHPATAPISRAADRRMGRAFARQPVCAGPYRLAKPYADGDKVVTLEAVRGYKSKNAAFTKGGVGYAERVEFHVFDSEAAAVDAYKAGRLDIAPVPAARVDEANALGGLVVGNGDAVELLGLPTATDSPLRNPAARIAFSQALNRVRLVEEAWGGSRVPAAGYLPPALGVFHRASGCGENAPLEGDVDAARATLARARVDLAGQSLKLYFNDEFGYAKLAAAAAVQWREAFGVEVQPVPMPWEDYSKQVRGSTGFDGAFRMSWSGTFASPDAYLAPLFSTEGLGSTNVGRYNERDFDRTLEDRGRKTANAEERVLGYHDVEDFVCRDLPLIPVAFTATRWLIRETVRSARPTALGVDGAPMLREFWLSASR